MSITPIAAPDAEVQLTKLAKILSRNLVTNSFAVNKAQGPIEAILGAKSTTEERSRNILVLGAGASHNVNPRIPLASKAIDIIKKAFYEKYGPKIQLFIDSHISQLVNAYKLNPDDFETQLLACSRIDNELVLSELTNLYNLRYPVSLFYEIVAHLFKHRFIDVIINFNFDEMLDNAIEEEMGDSQWRFIYSDGHCPEEMTDLLYDNRLSFPIYIKPHGTISHPSTLRFTREAYHNSPSKIRNTIIYLIEGITGYTNRKGDVEQLPVNLLVAGFGLKSHEFNSILTKYLEKKRASLYYFDVFRGEDIFERFKTDLIESFNKANSYFFSIEEHRTLDDWFFDLWSLIKKSFNQTYQPKDISRHVVLHEIFNPLAVHFLDSSYVDTVYFRDRAIIELAIEILNSNDGLINLRQLKESRFHKYFSLYKKNEIADKNLFDFLRMFELKIYKGYIKDTWCYDIDDSEFKNNVRRIVMANISRRMAHNIKRNQYNPRLVEYVEKLLSPKKLFLNLHTSARNNYISIFQNINHNDLINTDVKWIYTFHNYFLDPNQSERWNLVLSISETGGIFSIQELQKSLEGKKIMLICSYDANTTKAEKHTWLLEKKLKDIRHLIVKNRSNEEVRMLPFRNHNQHVVLFAKIDIVKQAMSFAGGIYYGRRNMSKKVIPIHVKSKADLTELFSVFANYWERARKDDNIDLLKKAILEGTITPAIKDIASNSGNRALKEIEKEIIGLFIADHSTV